MKSAEGQEASLKNLPITFLIANPPATPPRNYTCRFNTCHIISILEINCYLTQQTVFQGIYLPQSCINENSHKKNFKLIFPKPQKSFLLPLYSAPCRSVQLYAVHCRSVQKYVISLAGIVAVIRSIFCSLMFYKLFIFNILQMVEVAGVEPASRGFQR